MTRDTKLGLLIGLVFLIGIGMVLSGQVRNGADRSTSRVDSVRQFVPKTSDDAPAVAAAVNAATASPRRETTASARPPIPTEDYPDHTLALEMPRPVRAPLSDLTARPRGGSMVDTLAARPHEAAVPMAPASTIGSVQAPPPGPVDVAFAPAPAPALPPGWTTYTVQAGDYLGVISQKKYGTCRKADVIFQANRDQLATEHVIREGMTLRIPPVDGLPTPPPPTAVARSPAAPARAPSRLLDSGMVQLVPTRGNTTGDVLAAIGGRTPAPAPTTVIYRVREGDTLSTIAAEHLGSARKWQALYEANKDRIADPNIVPVGLEIRLPVDRLAARTQ